MNSKLAAIFFAVIILSSIITVIIMHSQPVKEVDPSTLYPVDMSEMPYPTEIVDTIVFPPYQAKGYWNTLDPRLKVVTYRTNDGKQHDVILYNKYASEIIKDIFERECHLITEVDTNGNHYAVHVIKPE